MKNRKLLIITLGLLLLGLSFLGWLFFCGPNVDELSARLKDWPSSPQYVTAEGQPLGNLPNSDGEYRFPVALNQMGFLPDLVIALEDHRFEQHHGIDFHALGGAIRSLLHRQKRGASTITTQMIRLARPSNRNLITKAQEFATAWRIERHWTKDEILTQYLNTAPFGGLARGAQAGALYWFGRPINKLSPAECATLAAMLKAPTSYRPDVNPEKLRQRRNLTLRRAVKLGRLDPKFLDSALQEPLNAKPHKLSFLSETASPLLLQTLSNMNAPQTTSLCHRLQGELMFVLRNSLVNLPDRITAAGLVIDSQDGSIVAYCPNARNNSWIDLNLSYRSPGSTLKPLAYGLCFEQGKLNPASLLADTPLNFRTAPPRNAGRTYRGPVSAKSALVDSLNPPAVRVLHLCGEEEFLRRLNLAGISLPHSQDFYGDSLILGGVEVTPLQLAQLAAGFANGGRRVTASFASKPLGNRFLSPESCWLLWYCLNDPTRIAPSAQNTHAADLALKTGTSYGLRDAWALAWDGRYAIVIWFGDPSGQAHFELTGANLAAPIAFELARALPEYTRPVRPVNVVKTKLCSLSGKKATAACPSSKDGWVIQTLPLPSCDLHHISNGKTVTVYPADLAAFMQSDLPATPLNLTSPRPNGRYSLDRNKYMLFCAEGASKLYWTLDGTPIGETTSGKPLAYQVDQGFHRAAVVDDYGRSLYVDFSVDQKQDKPQPIHLRPEKPEP